jgi:hypothetical protein
VLVGDPLLYRVRARAVKMNRLGLSRLRPTPFGRSPDAVIRRPPHLTRKVQIATAKKYLVENQHDNNCDEKRAEHSHTTIMTQQN